MNSAVRVIPRRMTSMLVMLFSNPDGGGISPGAASLQAGQGSPAPPHPQAFSRASR